MDQGLKERLIGAAVLVALGVWLIPWVLDGPDEQSEIRSAALQLPAPEEPVPIRTQTLRLDLPEPAGAADAVEPPPATAAPPASELEPQPAVTPTRAAPPEPSGDSVRAHGAAPAPQPATRTAPAPEIKPATAVETPAARSAASTQSAAGEWIVQLGSFGEEENARRLAQRVATFGYKPDISTHRTSGRLMYRVRVGPQESRARAAAAASALSAHGFVAQVVAAD